MSPGRSPLRVLFVALRFDYGRAGDGPSYEYANFFDSLRRMDGVEARFFPFDEVLRARGRKAMNADLLGTVMDSPPDLCFFFLFTDEITDETIRRIGGQTVTLNWFADDHWRFDGYSVFRAPLFHWVVTTDAEAAEKYRRRGINNVVRSKWGFNDAAPLPAAAAHDSDVTFVGQMHSNRRVLIDTLLRNGIAANCWGKGWPAGRLPQEELGPVFRRSRINLNFTESSAVSGFETVRRAFVSRRADGTRRIRPPREVAGHLRGAFRSPPKQIKGRNFEIPGAGGFLLTEQVHGLEEYFVPGVEIATFETDEELIEKTRYYLSHDDEREAIRAAGERRALADHTYRRRFKDLFSLILPGRLG